MSASRPIRRRLLLALGVLLAFVFAAYSGAAGWLLLAACPQPRVPKAPPPPLPPLPPAPPAPPPPPPPALSPEEANELKHAREGWHSFTYLRSLAAKHAAARSRPQGFCHQEGHRRWARKHARRLLQSLKTPAQSLDFASVVTAFEKLFAHSNWDKLTRQKTVLVQVVHGHLQLKAGAEIDDFTRNAITHLAHMLQRVIAKLPANQTFAFIYSSLAAAEQLDKVGTLGVPVFAHCMGRSLQGSHLLIPRAYKAHVRVPASANWTVLAAAWPSKAGKAVFRGALSGPERADLFERYQHRSKYTDVRMTSVPGFSPCDSTRVKGCHGMGSGPPKWVKDRGLELDKRGYLSMDTQTAEFRYVLTADGVGCADRLRQLLVAPVAVIKQESALEEFWYADLQPYEHYIPTANNFSDLESQVRWAEEQPASTLLDMVQKANEYANTFLNQDGFDCFLGELLLDYMSRSPAPPDAWELLAPGSVKIF